MNTSDFLGRTFGRLTVIAVAPIRFRWRHYVLCRCQCGAEREFSLVRLRSGNTKSCGCLRNERIGSVNRTHGLINSPEYGVWRDMRRRCQKPNCKSFPNYGGRGIRVCQEWADFAAFYADMGPRPSPTHSIERIDNDGDYSKENCRWATILDQASNRQRTVHLTFQGETQSVGDWSRRTGIPVANIHARRKLGWSLEQILTTPIEPPRRTPEGTFGSRSRQ